MEDIIFTSGIDSLADLYRNPGIIVECKACQYVWKPSKQIAQERIRSHQQRLIHEKRWKAAFYKAFEQNDQLEAGRLLEQEKEDLFRQVDLQQAYSILKRRDRSSLIFLVSFLALCVGLAIGLVFGFTE